MKIKNFIFFTLSGLIFSGITVIVYFSVFDTEATGWLLDQNRFQNPEAYTAASIPKGTILLLLAVGVIGALGVSRQKKDTGSDSHRNAADQLDQDINVNEDRRKLTSRNS